MLETTNTRLSVERDFKAKKVVEKSKVFHIKMLTKIMLEVKYALLIITSNNHIINIKKKKNNIMGCLMCKERSVMRARGKSKLNNVKAKYDKPTSWSLFQTI